MSRRFGCLVVCLLMAVSAVGADPADADIQIPPLAAGPPVLDGVMDDVWQEASVQYITNPVNGAVTGPGDNSGSWRVLWDSKYLYGFVDVNDDAYQRDNPAADSWRDDSVEFYVDGDNSKGASTDENDHQYRFTWGTEPQPVNEYFHQPGSLEGVEHAVLTTDDGYRFEFKIPWTSISSTPVSAASLIGIDVFINDDDDGDDRDSQLAWNATSGDGWNTPSMWATAYLIPSKRASAPTPGDGAVHADTWVNLGWAFGQTAVSNDVYVGTNYDDVVAGTGGTFQGNLTTNYIIIGFPGFAFPEGLVPGTTYYWRVDAVEADGVTKYAGAVWSLTLRDTKAMNPYPPVGAKFIDTDVELTWEPGFKARMHFVHFGTDYDTVNNSPVGIPHGATAYSPPGLVNDTVYYWRIDESDGANTTRGDIWSFRTTPTGGGLRGDYYSGMYFQTHMLTRMDDQIDFGWGNEGPDASMPADGFSVKWAGEVEAAFTEAYTFYTRTDDGARLWVDGKLIIDQWRDQGTTEHAGTIDLEAGPHSIEMEYYDNSGGATAELRWASPRTPKQLVPQGALSPPLRASGPRPSNGAQDTAQSLILEWNPGQDATSHNVYFGTDAAAVAEATTGSPEYKGARALGSESFDPGPLAWEATYYWRVDEVGPVETLKGIVWRFTTAAHLTIDDFEDYNNFTPDRVFETWIDGWGNSANGSIIGYPDPDFDADETFVETSIVHGGNQSMPFYYDNNMKYSEATRALSGALRDWTQGGVQALSLWYIGYPASQGSFVEGPAGTYTMTGAGGDIWAVSGVEADEFHFAWKTLQGAGSITARVGAITGDSLNAWAKAGVMIRETLDPNSAHALMTTTANQGVALQYRPEAAGTSVNHHHLANEDSRPKWIKLERDFSGNFTAAHANDVGGAPDKWTTMNSTNVQLASTVYIGLALTSHQRYVSATATFSNITTTGNVTGATFSAQDIGITSNAPESMFVSIKDAQGNSATVYNPDAAAANVTGWIEWGEYGQGVALSEFTAQNVGLDLSNIDTVSIGFGAKGNTQPGGGGLVFFDDVVLYRPRCIPELGQPAVDLNDDCVVDFADVEDLAGDWLANGFGLPADLNSDGTVDFRDYAGLAGGWLDEQLWP